MRTITRSDKDNTDRPVRIGMVGIGFVGQVAHLINYLAIDGCEVVAIADLRPELREAVRRRHNIPQAFETHQELLEQCETDAIVAITRRHHIGPIALDCLNAGKPLFTEKPMAATVGQGEQLVKAAEENVVTYAIGYMRRHDAGVQLAKETLEGLIESGDLGPVTMVRVYCYQGQDFCNCPGAVGLGEARPEGLVDWPVAPTWLAPGLHAAYDGFMNVFVHDINLMRYLFGRTPVPRHLDVRENGTGVALFDFGDFPAVLEFAEIEQDDWTEGVEIIFRHGRMTIDLPPAFLINVPASVTIHHGGKNGRAETRTAGWSWSFRRQAEAFINDVRTGSEPIASGKDALEDNRLIEALWKLAN